MIERGRFLLLRSLVVFAILVAINAPHYAYVAAQGDSVGERLTDYDIDSLPGTGNKSARGVCSDGTTLWVVEERALKLFAYSLEDDVPTRDEDGDIQLDFYENYLPGVLTASARTARTAISRRRFRDTQPGTVEPISRFFKLAAKGVANTLRAGTRLGTGRVYQPATHPLPLRPLRYGSRDGPAARVPGLVPVPRHEVARSAADWKFGPTATREGRGRIRPGLARRRTHATA